MDNQYITILMVEDDQVDAMAVKRVFQKLNILNSLLIAPDGEAALAILRGENPEHMISPNSVLVLLDINLPRMNGMEFLQILRQDDDLKAIPVLILISSPEDKSRLGAYNLDASGYILKPITFERLTEIMATINYAWALCQIS